MKMRGDSEKRGNHHGRAEERRKTTGRNRSEACWNLVVEVVAGQHTTTASLSLSRFFSPSFSLSSFFLCQFSFDGRLQEVDDRNNKIIHVLDFFFLHFLII